jgi:putative membrane protein
LATLLALTATSAFAAKPPDAFLGDAIQADNAEIMLGKLAEQKSANPRVQEFGRTLVADHTTAKEQASAVARALGVTPPDQPSAQGQDELNKLNSLSGAAFDREFTSFMVKAHQKDIAEFQDEAKANQGRASDLADKQLPVLNKHLDMAEAIAKDVGNAAAMPATMQNAATREAPDQWRASKLAGVAIYGPDNKKVGTITDVLVDKDGKAASVIIGVGGFLGIGEKDVSVAFDQVKFSDQPIVKPAMDTSSSSSLGNMGATSSQTDPSVVASASRNGAYPDHGTIDMTAEQLKQAPTFHFAS